MLEWIRTSYLNPSAANLWPVNSACSRPASGGTVRTLSLSLFPLRLYWECLMRRMLRVAFGLPLSLSELGSSVALSFFFPLISEDGSLLNTGWKSGLTQPFLKFSSQRKCSPETSCKATNVRLSSAERRLIPPPGEDTERGVCPKCVCGSGSSLETKNTISTTVS
uniref:Uncharacterized protein n=1 Tax=Anabas testudineus TaxID=64144 RepID=A0A3Q1IU70_ANATE